MRPSDSGGSPWGEPPDPDPGHGVPHPPGGGFTVQAKDLVAAGDTWDDVSRVLRKVHDLCVEGYGYPGLFGSADTLYVVGRLHQDFNASVCQAAYDGRYVTSYLADGLVETANDFAATDAEQGANFRTYRNEVSDD